MPEIILRQALAEDLDELAELELVCFPEEPWSRGMLAEEAENPQAAFIVAESCGRTAGYCIAWMIPPFECQIGSIATVPSERRKGVASRLLKAIEDICRELSIPEILLEVRASNEPAKRLYEGFDYKPFGIRKKYYANGEDAVNMKKELGL